MTRIDRFLILFLLPEWFLHGYVSLTMYLPVATLYED